jgi:hypothetical protein
MGIHQGYCHDTDSRDGKSVTVFTANLPEAGTYEVQVA